MSRAALRRAAGLAGALLCVIAVVFLVRRALLLGDALGEQLAQISPTIFLTALAIYCVANFLLALGWVQLVRLVAGRRVPGQPLIVAQLCSQIAKYLPGNVFHFAYRHLAARREGVGHGALGLALGLESVLLIAAAAILAVGVVSDPRLDALAPWASQLIWAAPLLALLLWAALGLLGRKKNIAQLHPARTAAPLGGVLLLDLAFFVLGAIALRQLCDDPTAMPFAAWYGWLALAWVLGYVTPGAPAGLGLREAVLALGMAPVLGEAGALALALLYRLLTLTSDAILALLGFCIGRFSPAAATKAEG